MVLSVCPPCSKANASINVLSNIRNLEGGGHARDGVPQHRQSENANQG